MTFNRYVGSSSGLQSQLNEIFLQQLGPEDTIYDEFVRNIIERSQRDTLAKGETRWAKSLPPGQGDIPKGLLEQSYVSIASQLQYD